MRTLLLLSGPLAVGKTAVARELIRLRQFATIRSGSYLADRARQIGIAADRTALQQLGDTLDSETDYKWLIDQVAMPAITAAPEVQFWLLDCVRKARQISHFRSAFPSRVLHAHLTAPEALLRRRYEERLAAGGEYLGKTPYETAAKHPNEVSARSLSAVADIVIGVAERTPEEVAASVLDGLGGMNASGSSY